MHLNDLLRGQRIDPEHVLVLRHRPHEPQLRKVLPWFAAEAPEVFNAYQQTRGRTSQPNRPTPGARNRLAVSVGYFHPEVVRRFVEMCTSQTFRWPPPEGVNRGGEFGVNFALAAFRCSRRTVPLYRRTRRSTS